MGNSNKKPEDYEVVRTFKPEQWINKEKRPNCQVWQNTVKNVRADVHPIKSDIKPVDLDHYEMRYNNSQDIVKVHNLHINQEAGLCSKPADAHVYVQRIPLRLNNVQDLSRPEALSVLRSSYSGFNTISTFYGPVEPYEDLICFNEQGQTKVWVNSNLAVNTPAKQVQNNKVGNLANANVAYVNKILDLVENRTSNGSFPARLKNKFREANPKTYFEALNLVEEYAAEERIQIPSNINLRWGDLSQNRTQFNTVSKVSSYTNGTQPGSYYQNSAIIRQAQFPQDQSHYVANANQSIVRAPVQQNTTFQNFVQPADFSKFRSQSAVSFGEPVPFTQSNARLPPVLNNSRVGPVSPRINYPIGPGIPNNTVFPRTTPIPIQNTPVVKFESPSKVIIHEAVRPFVANNIQPAINIGTPLKSGQSSPVKTVPENNRNLNEVSAQKIQQSENRYVQRVQTKIETPRVLSATQENKLIVNQVNQAPPKIIINAQPSYQQVLMRPQGVVSIQQANSTIRLPPQPNFSIPRPYIDANRTQIGQQIRNQVIVQQVPIQQIPVQQPVNVSPPVQPASRAQTQISQQLVTREQRAQTKVQQVSIVTEQNQPQKQEEVPKVIPAPVVVVEQVRPHTTQINNQFQGYEEGYEEDEMERQLEQLQARNVFVSSSKQIIETHEHKVQSGDEQPQQQEREAEVDQQSYFPFAGQILNQKAEEKLRRVQTTELRHQEFLQEENHKEIQHPQVFKHESHVQVPLGEDHEEYEETEKQIVSVPQIKQDQTVEQVQEGVQTSYDRDHGYQYQYKTSFAQNKATERIPDDARYEDIEQYIRNKYQTFIGVNENPFHQESIVTPYQTEGKKVDQREIYSYVESKYDQYSNQDMQFSFRPTQEQQPTIKQDKASLISSYEYMRIEPMYGGPEISVETFEQVKPELKKENPPVAEVRRVENEVHEDDILDVKNMERSLDKKYSSMKSNQQIKDLDSIKREEKDDNEFDVKKLEQNLMRFDESINHTSNISEPRFETSQVSKINSIDEKLGNRRSSMNRDFGYKDQIHEVKSYTYENQSPIYEVGKKSRVSKISKEISDIDEKFSKYVKQGNGAISSSSSKAALKPKEDNYGYRDYDYDSSSRMATGHFGYSEYSKGEDRNTKNYNRQKTTFVTSDVKSPSYEDLRKYMWS